MPQSLAAPAFAGLFTIVESGIKADLTTGMTTDRKIFIFSARRGIMAEIEYPGVAQLVGRDIWDVEVGCSSHLTRTKIPLKLLISEGFSYSLSIAAQATQELKIDYASPILFKFTSMVYISSFICFLRITDAAPQLNSISPLPCSSIYSSSDSRIRLPSTIALIAS